MRKAFIETLTEIAGKDDRVMLMTADLGYTVLEKFSDSFPERYFNVGVAEQNMVGMATGMAGSGLIPFVYSIVTFASLRPYEFIRNGPILHKLPVRIIAIGEGFDYGSAGVTHYGLEDVAVMRTQKGMTTVVPSDDMQAREALLKTWDLPGPVYYRIGKGSGGSVAGLNGNFELGKADEVIKGEDVVFVCMGGVSKEVVTASENLAKKNISSSVVIVSSFNPSPDEDIARVLKKFKKVITVEAHYTTGGLGSYVAEVVADNGLHCKVLRCGIGSKIEDHTGSRNFMNDKYGISSERLEESAINFLKE